MLQRVWAEMYYRRGVCRVTKGRQIEHLRGTKKTWRVSLSICRSRVTIISDISSVPILWNVLRNYEEPCTFSNRAITHSLSRLSLADTRKTQCRRTENNGWTYFSLFLFICCTEELWIVLFFRAKGITGYDAHSTSSEVNQHRSLWIEHPNPD